MQSHRSWTARAALVAALTPGLASCNYDPKPADGTLLCGPKDECPNGYTCGPSGDAGKRCRVNGAAGGDAGIDARDAGAEGGNDGSVPMVVLQRYIGTWAYARGSTIHTMCDDNSTATDTLDDLDPMEIRRGLPGVYDLVASPCDDLTLRLDAAGAHLTTDAPQTCSETTGTLVSTWRATRFDVFTANGQTGTYMGVFELKLVDPSEGLNATCTQTETANIMKQNN